MQPTLEDYFFKMYSDSQKYFEYNKNVVGLKPEMLPLNVKKLFNNSNDICKFEIGFGNGESLIQLARRNPHINYFGIDRKMDRVRKAHSKLSKIEESLDNLVISRIGTDYLVEMFEMELFDEIIMNFPDPWPKKRHHKNRTINSDF